MFPQWERLPRCPKKVVRGETAHEEGYTGRTISQEIARRRQRFLRHVLRHPEELEHQVCLTKAHSYRKVGTGYRVGKPRAHWIEGSMLETAWRYDQVTDAAPP